MSLGKVLNIVKLCKKKKTKHVTQCLRHRGRMCQSLVKIQNKRISNQRKTLCQKQQRSGHGHEANTRSSTTAQGCFCCCGIEVECRVAEIWSGIPCTLQTPQIVAGIFPWKLQTFGAFTEKNKISATSFAPKLGGEISFPLLAGIVALKLKVTVCHRIILKPTLSQDFPLNSRFPVKLFVGTFWSCALKPAYWKPWKLKYLGISPEGFYTWMEVEELCVNKRFMRSTETDRIGKWWCLGTTQHKCYFHFCLQHSRRETKWPMTNSTPGVMRDWGWGWELVHKVTISATFDCTYHNEPAPNEPAEC